MEALVRKADSSSHSHPRQYAGLGFRIARLPDLAGVAIAAAPNAADLATADRTPGIFSDGFVAARNRARQRFRAASCLVGGGAVVCVIGTLARPCTARRGQKKRDGDPSGQLNP